jgi:hypothetical protein
MTKIYAPLRLKQSGVIMQSLSFPRVCVVRRARNPDFYFLIEKPGDQKLSGNPRAAAMRGNDKQKTGANDSTPAS